MNTHTVLICDDNEVVHESLKKFFQEENIRVISVYCGEDVFKVMQTNEIHLIILDIMLPGISGTDLCREIRRTSEIPIIFLSAKGEEIDRIIGLELGADDYVTKPFSPREVTIRTKKLLSRTTADFSKSLLQYEELAVNSDTYEVFVKGNKIENMSAKEVKLLLYLLSNPHKVLNREQILKAVWDYECYCDTRAVDAVIKRIRQKLPMDDTNFSIQSIYGVGYRLGNNTRGTS